MDKKIRKNKTSTIFSSNPTKLKIFKQDSENETESETIDTETKYTETEYTNNETYTETNDNETKFDTETSIVGGGGGYTSIVDTNYKKSKKGSIQDNLTKEEIRQKLSGYIPLRTMHDKKYLLAVKPFKSYVRYYNIETKQFRLGGLLTKVDPDLKFIMLVNSYKKLTWSVQLEDNIIFIKNPENFEEKLEEVNKMYKERKTKEKLYELYLKGRLSKI